MDAVNDQAHYALLEVWRELRNDFHGGEGPASAIVDFAKEAGLLTPSQHELWTLRLQKCPGHEDEGGRDWCAYGCDMAKLRERGETS